MSARKACAQPRCPNLQPCPEHQRAPWEGSDRKARLPGSREWERIRRYVLRRDPICKSCQDAVSTEVDHIEPGDDHSYKNLQGLCSGCHRDKTQRESAAARRRTSQ